MRDIKSLRYSIENVILRYEEVTGIAHDEEKNEIIIFVEREQDIGIVPSAFKLRNRLIGSKIIVTGKIKVLSPQEKEFLPLAAPNRTERKRPLVGGISVGVVGITAGTLSCITYDKKILSNAHVIGMIKTAEDCLEDAKIGSPILQPGPYDGGKDPSDRIGSLEKSIKIPPPRGEELYIDAAIGKLTEKEYKAMEVLAEDNVSTYKVHGIGVPKIGDVVKKSGRTTGTNTATVTANNATIDVFYPCRGNIWLHDQIITTDFSDKGDSGSLVFDKEHKCVGLIYAGSPGRTTIICKIQRIIDEYNIDVGQEKPIPPEDEVIWEGIAWILLALIVAIIASIGLLLVPEQ